MADENDIKSAETAEKAYATAAEAGPVPTVAPVTVAAETVAEPAKTPAQPVVADIPVATVPVTAPIKAKAAAKPKASVKVAAPVAVKAVAVKATTPAPKKAASLKKPVTSPQPQPVKAAKPAPKRVVKRTISRPAKPAARPAKNTQTSDQTIAELKEKIMATAKKNTTDYSKVLKDVQGKAKAAYAKSGAVAGEVTAFTKGNVGAVVASGKILATGAKTLGKDYIAESKGAFETLTGDLKAFAAVKSPTELFQLQGKLARRNFDAAVAFSSKTSESLVKLANEAFAPISNRVSIAVDKVSKAA